MENSLKYNCIFGGGGIRGLCYIGALKALKEFNAEIKKLAGSSVGAVFAGLYAIGYSEDEIKELFLDFDLNMFRDINIGWFNPDISISKGEIFLNWLRDKFSLKYYGRKYSQNDKPITFKDINTDLSVLATDLSTNMPFVFSKENTPDAEIALAIRASAALPGLMKAINYQNSILVDGDLIKSWRAWKLFENFNELDARVLEFRLEGVRNNDEIKNPLDYASSIIDTLNYFSTANVFNDYHENDRFDFVVIDTKDLILFDFTVDTDERENLINKGYNTTKNFFEKTLLNKKIHLAPIYRQIKEKLYYLELYFNQNKVDNVLFKANEISTILNINSKFSDELICENITNLIQLLKNNISKKMFNVKKFNNLELINSKILFSKNLIARREEEILNYIRKVSNKN